MTEILSGENSLSEKRSRFSFSFMVIVFIAVYCIMYANFWKTWKTETGTPFTWDVNQYYSYLPATFIHHDLTFSFPNNYWLHKTPTGKNLPMPTYGMALMYLPSFLVGYKLAINGKEKIDGYSEGFIDAIHYGTIFYFICAILFLRNILLRYFKEITVGIGILTVFFGTNLFHYVVGSGEMPHSYLFFLFTVFLWLTIKWHETPKVKYSIFLGIILGLATLIRPTEVSVALIFILYGIRNKNDFKHSVRFFTSHWMQLLIIALCFMAVLLPQMLYWKMQTGSYWYNSYGENSKFWFENPKIREMLFSYRKGWFVYTPVMIFAIVGMFFSKKYIPKFNIPVIIYFLINFYLLASWWCWWFGGGFGMRALVQTYAFLIFFLCIIIEKVLDSYVINNFIDRSVKYGSAALLTFLISLNLIQTYQLKIGILHYDAMTEKTYWLVFRKFELTGSETTQYWANLKAPDYEGSLKRGWEK